MLFILFYTQVEMNPNRAYLFAFRMEGQVELNVKGEHKKGTFGF